MKIALFFILVAVSSCFAVDAELLVQKKECKATIQEDHVVHLMFHFSLAINIFLTKEKSGDPCHKQVLLAKMFSVMDQLTLITDCPHQMIASIMVACLPAECKTIAGNIGNYLLTRNINELLKVHIDICAHVLIATGNTLNVVMAAAKLDVPGIATKAMMSLAGWCNKDEMIAAINYIAQNLKITMDHSISAVNGVMCLIIGNDAVPLGATLAPVSSLSDFSSMCANMGLGGIATLLAKVLQSIGSFLGLTGDLNIDALTQIAGNIIKLPQLLSNVVQQLSGTLLGLDVGDLTNILTNTAGDTLGTVTNPLGGTRGGALGSVTNPLGGALGLVTDTLGGALGGTRGGALGLDVGGLINGVTSTVKDLTNGVTNNVAGLVPGAR